MWLSKTAGAVKEADQFPLITTRIDGWSTTAVNSEAFMSNSQSLRLGSGWDLFGFQFTEYVADRDAENTNLELNCGVIFPGLNMDFACAKKISSMGAKDSP